MQKKRNRGRDSVWRKGGAGGLCRPRSFDSQMYRGKKPGGVGQKKKKGRGQIKKLWTLRYFGGNWKRRQGAADQISLVAAKKRNEKGKKCQNKGGPK